MKIVVTGFGPFDGHPTNASWQAVQKIPQLWENSEYKKSVEIVTEEIPVSYSFVQGQVPSKWKPVDFVVHVGVSGMASTITLETCANNSGYNRPDVDGSCPAGQVCNKECDDRLETLNTCLPVQQICQDLNDKLQEDGIEFTSSCNAGRYLCEFVYYASLSQTENCTLFVHVPPLDQPYSQDELAKALVCIIEQITKFLEEKKKS
eukprot:TRINITY_DN27144_c0_g1_i1.p1 TRINITY_DN27144_c0_g1~~TRINITY_DN27144_c0_g1_i1.p1  ORF type:complete len:205 (-),score=36.52 TRINITY_DN27144_c0_g1_i1:264-878(-)